MRTQVYKDEAEKCRREATNFQGKYEEIFLLKVASCFEELAQSRANSRNQHATAERCN